VAVGGEVGEWVVAVFILKIYNIIRNIMALG
jgi:hypothetical protein